MNKKYANQCLRAIHEGDKMERDIKLSLSETLRLKKVTKILRETKSFTNILFEDFVLICKLHKINAMLFLTVPSYNKTYKKEILEFDNYTLKSVMYEILDIYNEPLINRNGNSYDISDIKYYLYVTKNIYFEDLLSWSDLLGFRIDIV